MKNCLKIVRLTNVRKNFLTMKDLPKWHKPLGELVLKVMLTQQSVVPSHAC